MCYSCSCQCNHTKLRVGKTILASKIVESCKDISGFKTSYFYCQNGYDSTTTCNSILKGLVHQMINHCDALVPFCHDKMNRTGESTLTTEDLAKQLLEQICKEIPKQFIIIDGLDECDQAQRGNLLKVLTAIVKVCDETLDSGKPRLLIVSRKLGDIEHYLAEANWMEIRRHDNRQDIEAFVRYKKGPLQAKFALSQQVTDDLETATNLYAEGIYTIRTLLTPVNR